MRFNKYIDANDFPHDLAKNVNLVWQKYLQNLQQGVVKSYVVKLSQNLTLQFKPKADGTVEVNLIKTAKGSDYKDVPSNLYPLSINTEPFAKKGMVKLSIKYHDEADLVLAKECVAVIVGVNLGYKCRNGLMINPQSYVSLVY